MLTRLLSLLSSGLLYVVSRSHTNTLKVSKFLHRQSYVLLSHLGKLPETEGFTSLVAFSVNSQEGQLFFGNCGKPRGGATGGGGGGGGDCPPKGFKKEKNMGYFHALKLAFLSSLIRKYMLWEGYYHDFSTKKVSAPHQGALPSGPSR